MSNSRVSCAKLVLVTLNKIGANYFPDIEYLRGKKIQYIDYIQQSSLPAFWEGRAGGVPTSSTANKFLTLYSATERFNVVQDLPLERLDLSVNNGYRLPVDREISLLASSIEVTSADEIGKTVPFVIWYEQETQTHADSTKLKSIEGFEIKLATSSSGKFKLPDNRVLVNKKYRKIYFNLVGTTPNGRTGITAAEAAAIYLTANNNSFAVLDQIPISYFEQLNTLKQLEYKNIMFDFQSSFIELSTTILNPDTKSVYLSVEFEQ